MLAFGCRSVKMSTSACAVAPQTSGTRTTRSFTSLSAKPQNKLHKTTAATAITTLVPATTLTHTRAYSHDKKNYKYTHYERPEADKHLDKKHQMQANKDKHKPLGQVDTVLEFCVYPIGTNDDSMSSYTATCARIVANSGMNHEVNAMGTIVEGSIDDCLDIVKDCVNASLKRSPRIMLSIKADIRPGLENRLHKKRNKINIILSQVETH